MIVMRATFAETFAGCFAELAETSKRRDEMIDLIAIQLL